MTGAALMLNDKDNYHKDRTPCCDIYDSESCALPARAPEAPDCPDTEDGGNTIRNGHSLVMLAAFPPPRVSCLYGPAG
jgi:hypothetical protein